MSKFERLILRGVGGKQYLGFARRKAQELMARAKGGARSAFYKLQGGAVTVKVRVVGLWKYIEIKCRICPDPLHGMVWCKSTLNPIVADEDGNPAFEQFYPRADKNNAVLEPRLADFGYQLLAVRSTMFTGEMRKVVQILLGRDLPVPYSPLFSLTHGVFVTRNGMRWIIRISPSGMVAYPMTVCIEPGDDAALGYVPIPTIEPTGDERTAAIAAGTYIQLLTAAQLNAFYGNAPFFAYCGWAFSESGHKIANVCVGNKDLYIYSYMYTITITEEDGKPAHADIRKADEGYLHVDSTTHMKYPASSNLALRSFMLNQSLPPRICESPVYCFYDGEELVACRFMWNPTTAVTETVVDPEYIGGPSALQPTFFTEYNNGRTVQYGQRRSATAAHFTVSGRQTPNSYEESLDFPFYTYHFTAHYIGINITIGSQALGYPVGASTVYELSDFLATQGTSQSHRQVLAVPLFEREAVYVLAHTTTQFIADQENNHVPLAGAFFEFFNTEVLETCHAPATGGPITINVMGIGGYNFFRQDGQPYYGTLVTSDRYLGSFSGGPIQLMYQYDDPQNPIFGNCTTMLEAMEIHGVQQLIDRGAHTVYSREGKLFASGGITRTLNIKDETAFDEWFRPISEYNWQAPQVVRDAFAPGKMAYSEHPLAPRGSQMKNDTDYPVNEVTGMFFHFVGEAHGLRV